MHANLQTIEPGEAQQWYLEDRADSLSENSLKAHGYRTKHFVRWCGIDNTNVLTGRHFACYKAWRQEDGDFTDRAESEDADLFHPLARRGLAHPDQVAYVAGRQNPAVGRIEECPNEGPALLGDRAQRDPSAHLHIFDGDVSAGVRATPRLDTRQVAVPQLKR